MGTESEDVGLRQEKTAWVFTLPPRLDAAVEDSLSPAVDRALAAPPRLLVLDFTRVVNAGSAGIGAIVDTLRRASARGATVVLACLRGQPRLVLERIGLTSHIKVYDSVEEAMAGGNPA